VVNKWVQMLGEGQSRDWKNGSAQLLCDDSNYAVKQSQWVNLTNEQRINELINTIADNNNNYDHNWL